MKAAYTHHDPVAYLYTNAQSGEVEVSLDDDLYSGYPENNLWGKTPLYADQGSETGSRVPRPLQEPCHDDHITQRFNRVE